MRVCHVITDLNTGGAEMMLYKLVSAMDGDRFKNTVVSMTDIGPVGEKIQTAGIPVHALGMRVGAPDPRGLWRLNKLIRRTRPAIVQGWMFHANLASLLAWIWPFNFKIPLVWGIRHTVYDMACEKRLTALTIKLCAKLSHLPRKIIYNARVSAEKHGALGYKKDKTVIIPNGFDLERFVPDKQARFEVRAELGLRPEALLIGLVARYHPHKGHGFFLAAASLLVSRYPDVHFLLAGDNVTRDNTVLWRQAQNNGLANNIHLLGRRENVPRIMAALDIATTASVAEAFPNVVGEAMACGVPCVVTDVGDAAYIVGDCGLVVAPGNPEALAEAWAVLVENGAAVRRAYGEKARQRVVEHFALNKIVQKYETIYTSIVGG